MRRLIYFVDMSVDGFMAAPDGSFDFFPHEGDHTHWIIENYPESVPGHIRGPLGMAETPPRVFDTVLMGRRTHQVTVDEGLTSGYPHLRQYVFTTHPVDLPTCDGLTVTARSPVDVVRELKAESAGLDIWLCGGGTLAATLLDEIDELRLRVSPLLLGAGIPVIGPTGNQGFSARPLTRRRLLEFESGVTYVEYVRT